jgi:hypothetical protein
MAVARSPQEGIVRLRPDHLGSLTITVTSDRHVVSAQIVTETSAARQIIDAGRDQLRQSLEQHGLALARLDVGVGGGAAGHAHTFERPDPRPTAWPGHTPGVSPAQPVEPVPWEPQRRAFQGRLDYRA